MIEFAPFATGRPPCMLRSSFDSHDSTVEDDRRLLLGGGSLLLHPFPILPERGEFLTKRNELFDPPPLPFPIFTSRFVHFPSFHRATVRVEGEESGGV